MKQARQLLMLAICAAFSLSLSAQVYEVNLASITEINVTLNDDCEALVIPEMVLTGDFDVDGDGISPADSGLFTIVVEDSNPANGPIIDECGRFVYRVEAMDEVTVTEPFIGIRSTINTDAGGPFGSFLGAGGDNTTIDFFIDGDAGTPSDLLRIRTGSGATGPTAIGVIDIAFYEAGDFSFDYDFSTDGDANPGDVAFAFVNFEGEPLAAQTIDEQIIDGEAGQALTGTVELDGVMPGYLLRVGVLEDGVEGTPLSRFDIFNVEFDPIDIVVPVTGFTSQWGYVNAEDKTAPTVENIPTPNGLLCVDLDGNNVSTLGTDVDRCYQVFANDESAAASGQPGAVGGSTVAGSMSPALNARLRAGGSTPLVPTFADGCSALIDVCVNDIVEETGRVGCDPVTITRTFTATEVAICPSASGESNPSVSATYVLTFDRPSLDDLNADNIQPTVSYPRCGTTNPTRADYPAPRPGDFPFLEIDGRTLPLTDGDATCNIGVTFADGDPIVTCPFTYKFVRTYTVIDWCFPSDVRTFTQVVKVGDEEPVLAQNFVGPNVPTNADGDLVFGTNAGNICAAYIRLDDVRAVDNCSGTNVDITASIYPNRDRSARPIGAFTVVPGGSPELTSAIPAGSHELVYTVVDQCGNTAEFAYDFVVEDQTPPVAICEDGLNISIAGGANNGFAVLTASNIDAGSYDDCSAVKLSIAFVDDENLPVDARGRRITDAQFEAQTQITLTCDNVGVEAVGLRVEDALGNVNYCWLDVLVEDKLRPTCVAPGNTSITCDVYNETLPADISDLNTPAGYAQLDGLFGQAAGVDNCGTTITQEVSGDINSCGVGNITREFESTDGAGFTNANNCIQFIEVIGVHDYRLTFPVDVSGECATIPSYDDIAAEEYACDLITTVTDVDTLRTQLAGDECFKLRITYDVVNWCEYNSLGEPYVIPRDADGARNRSNRERDLEADPLYVNVIPNNTSSITDDRAFITLFSSDRNFNPLPVSRQNDRDIDAGYGTSDSRGFFRYTQFIKIYDEDAPEITFTPYDECFVGNDANCATAIELEFVARDECSDADVTVELDPFYDPSVGFVSSPSTAAALGVTVNSDEDGNFIVTASNVPAGDHAIRVSASDGCGNFDVQIIEFCVTADRTPTPICITDLTVVLADDGNNGGIAEIWASDFIASPIFDCEGNPVSKYSLYRADDADATIENAEFDPPATDGIDDIDCEDFANGSVRVRLFAFDELGSTPNFCEVIVTVQDNAGFCGGSDGDLSGIITTDNDEVLEGVTVALTGDNMNATVATDANGNFRFTGLAQGADYTIQPTFDAPANLRNIKTSDLSYMIGRILGTLEFDSPYDFVAADVNRDMELNIFDVIGGSQLILGIETEFAGGNWVFVSADASIDMNNPYGATFPEVYNVNDLEGSIRGVEFIGVELGNPFHEEGRSAQVIEVENAKLEAGQVHTIVLDGSALAGFQGTIELAAGLELVAADFVGEGGMNLNNAAEGLVAIAVRDNAVVTLEVRATEAGLISEMVTLTDAITVREGVTVDGASNGLELGFTAVAGELANSLGQNSPNPVADVTTIAYNLAAAGQVTLNVQDVQGRTILVREMEGVAGLNTVTLNVSELGAATGVLSYTLTAGNFSATKKMVVVR